MHSELLVLDLFHNKSFGMSLANTARAVWVTMSSSNKHLAIIYMIMSLQLLQNVEDIHGTVVALLGIPTWFKEDFVRRNSPMRALDSHFSQLCRRRALTFETPIRHGRYFATCMNSS